VCCFAEGLTTDLQLGICKEGKMREYETAFDWLALPAASQAGDRAQSAITIFEQLFWLSVPSRFSGYHQNTLPF